ncbi:ArsR/SmtB family transcription factor [Streptomyces odontomachi]|uniref:ArsR/SmtB family transcription factor n=1 Tax=Streptomyces odontomachi TaxID=2944940 RepID=UPI00210C65C2|nr:metalloregulator ArsR/SmtB family transcription factor [Streptomyces sp. ODS25]
MAASVSEDRVFAALASPVRREVLRLLREEGPQPVAALAGRFDMARPSFSEHLRVLRECGLVSEARSGRQRWYRLQAAPLEDVRDWLGPFERFWRDRLTALGAVLDAMPDDDSALDGHPLPDGKTTVVSEDDDE